MNYPPPFPKSAKPAWRRKKKKRLEQNQRQITQKLQMYEANKMNWLKTIEFLLELSETHYDSLIFDRGKKECGE